MIIWINGAFGVGKTTAAYELSRRLLNSYVYDPENIGYFIRKNTPEALSTSDFQDVPLWREMNYKMLRMIAGQYEGTVIVPMTLVNPGYFDEIIGVLRRDGIEIKHYILYASRETILKRLRLRSIRMLGRESFAQRSIDRCLHSFDNLITETKIITDDLSIDEVVSEIACLAGLPLSGDRRSTIGKRWDRVMTLIRHIRH